MPLMPKRVKYRKVQRGSNAGLATTNNKLDFGDFALQALTRGYVTNNQIEAARVAINRHLKRRGKVWIRLFPFRSFTKKPLEVRMGKGKGASFWQSWKKSPLLTILKFWSNRERANRFGCYCRHANMNRCARTAARKPKNRRSVPQSWNVRCSRTA